LFGVTRQAYYQHFWQETNMSIEQELVLQRVIQIRKNHRYIGGRKLYELTTPFMLEHQIKIGRDGLFDLLSANNLLVRKKRRKVYTTQSFHWLRKYPNLIKEFVPTAPNQLWVSDITYWKTEMGFVYISFITDAYSHKIVGYNVAKTLESIESIQSLKMALSDLGSESHFQLVHHSDRGIQYCSEDYVDLLNQYNIKISMTEKGDPLENAIAERVNGIIKEEYLCDYKVSTINEAKEVLDFVIKLYNEERPHMSIGNLLPSQVHEQNLKTEKLWKSYYKKNPIIVNQF
jgi:putative transposase